MIKKWSYATLYCYQHAWAKVKFFYRCFVSLKEFFLGIIPIKKRKRPARNPRTGRLICARYVMKKLIYKIIGTINFIYLLHFSE